MNATYRVNNMSAAMLVLQGPLTALYETKDWAFQGGITLEATGGKKASGRTYPTRPEKFLTTVTSATGIRKAHFDTTSGGAAIHGKFEGTSGSIEISLDDDRRMLEIQPVLDALAGAGIMAEGDEQANTEPAATDGPERAMAAAAPLPGTESEQ